MRKFNIITISLLSLSLLGHVLTLIQVTGLALILLNLVR